jgi:hypothetical protein
MSLYCIGRQRYMDLQQLCGKDVGQALLPHLEEG